MCVLPLEKARETFAVQIAALHEHRGDDSGSDDDPVGFVPPAMPVILRPVGYKPVHRQKIPDLELPFPACVARAVNKTEIAAKPAAQAAMDLEFQKLRDKKHPGLKKPGCWDESLVEELHVVKARARHTGETMHFGRIFGICVEKGSELPVGDKNRKFKGRYVFQGNEVKDQNWDAAIFQELGSSPAAMEAGNSADFYGLLPGNRTAQADAEQAYTQSLLLGTKTWVILPRERWPEDWIKRGLKQPVCPLMLALYGHPDAGGYWEKHCEAHLHGVLASGMRSLKFSLWFMLMTLSCLDLRGIWPLAGT